LTGVALIMTEIISAGRGIFHSEGRELIDVYMELKLPQY